MEMDAQVKLAVAMSILRARSQSVDDVQHWKKKAKERKNKLAKLKHDLKQIEDDMLSKMLPQVASCKCNFFDKSDESSLEGQIGSGERDTYSINQVLFRQFLRQVHLTKRLKNHKDLSAGCHLPNDTLQVLLAREEDDKFIVGLVNDLGMHLIERIYCTSKYDDLDSTCQDNQFHIQHIMRKLGAVPFIGQRLLLAASQAITSLADSLLCMGPFDSTIPQVHNCMFIMFQLIEHLVSDYTYSWATEPTFCDRLLEEWIHCYFQVKKATDMLEPRNSLYTIYINRITGELAKQLNKISSLKEQDNGNIHKYIDIWRSLFT